MRLGFLVQLNAEMYTTYKLKWASALVRILGIDFHTNQDLMSAMNFKSINTKVVNLFNVWSIRDLSLWGHIQIVNTLVISQYKYKLLMISTLSNSYLLKLQKEIISLWKGQRP